ncbi:MULTISPECIES: hypothetical protein [Streptomyces]|uniref:Secreted protein n=1 Tax=Streptomyces fimbriatus TaxID=68197 RepID=A0ABW0DK51_STRFI
MINTHRMLTALVLAGAALTTAGTAHADAPDSTSGRTTSQATSAGVQGGGEGLLGKAGETLAPLASLLGLNKGGQPG